MNCTPINYSDEHIFQELALRYKEGLDMPTPRKRYILYFTPRSGSTWLASALCSTGKLGVPQEYFQMKEDLHHKFKFYHSTDIADYCDVIQKISSYLNGGIFGMKTAYGQILENFCDEEAFFSLFSFDYSFFLIREDIVMQAISLAKAISQKIFHSTCSTSESIAKGDKQWTYNTEEIKFALQHVFYQEKLMDEMLIRRGINVHCLSYERILDAGVRRTVAKIAEMMKEETIDIDSLVESYVKVGTSKNQQFAERFREENAEFLTAFEERRKPTLERLVEV